MIGTLRYLFLNRVREKPFTYAWYRVWGKRLVNVGALITLLYRVQRLSRKAGTFGDLCIVGNVELSGKAHLLTVGRQCVLGNGVRLALHDEIRLGNNVVINDDCILLTASHDVDSPDWRQTRAPIVIEDQAWIATRAIVLPGVTIGRAAVVGAGAVVTKNVPAFHVVAGNPARTIKERRRIEYLYSPSRFAAPYEAWVGLPQG